MLFLLLQAAEACDRPADTSELQAVMERAEEAYGSLDLAGFTAATDELEVVLGCLSDPITRPVAAHLHRMHGLRAFVDQESEDAKLAFAAARALQPSYRFPETFIPTGNPVLVVYDAVPLTMGTAQTVSSPGSDAYWGFDGRTTDQRPVNWPTVVQRFDGSGGVAETAYLWPDDALPVPESVPPPVAPPLPTPDPVSTPAPEAGGSTVLVSSAAATAVVAAVVYGTAWRAHQNFYGEGLSDAQIRDYYDKARKRTALAAGVGAVSFGLGLGAALTW